MTEMYIEFIFFKIVLQITYHVCNIPLIVSFH